MKKFAVSIILIIAALFLFACSAEPSFDNLIILADDVSGIAEGSYTLRYSIQDYDKLNEKFDLSIQTTAFDQNNRKVDVVNNRTIEVKADCVYTVTVLVSANIDGQVKTKTKIFTVTAIKNDLKISFYLHSTDVEYKSFTVPYGTTLDIEKYSYIPDAFTLDDTATGVKQKILSKKWYVLLDGYLYELEQKDLTEITQDLKIIAIYKYETIYSDITVSFENGEGASETEAITQTAHSDITAPDFPTKAGYIFDGWYTDKDYKNIFSWPDSYKVITDTVLYAKWVKDETSDYEKYFIFIDYTDADGYPYYKAFLDRNTDYPKDIKVPCGHNNIPVKGFEVMKKDPFEITTLGGLQETDITSVVLPETFRYGSSRAFMDCSSLSSVTFCGTSLSVIGKETFKNCTSLTSITLPSGITTLSENVFEGCVALAEINLPDTLVTVNNNVFKGCSALKKIEIPDSVLRIYISFVDCASLEEVAISEKSALSFISPGAFAGCSSLKSITLPYTFKNKMSTAEIFGNLNIKINYHPQQPSD